MNTATAAATANADPFPSALLGAADEIPPFELDRFLRSSKPLDLTGIDFDAAKEHPLSESEVRCLQYMQDIELYTVHYMKALMETKALADTEARSFLVVWGYEECCHGRALARILEATGNKPSARSIEQFGKPRGWLEVVQDVASRTASAFSEDFLAVHMTWGAINELTGIYAYARLAQLTKNPQLAELCHRIIKDERRHFAFYYQQARRRLLTPWGRRLARLAIKHFWTPVGGSMAPADDVGHMGFYLFADEEGIACLKKTDRTIAELPGMEWFDLVSKQALAGAERFAERYPSYPRPPPS